MVSVGRTAVDPSRSRARPGKWTPPTGNSPKPLMTRSPRLSSTASNAGLPLFSRIAPGSTARTSATRRSSSSTTGARSLPKVAGRQRARLLTRLEQLKKQHGWGDLGDAEYQAQRDAVRTALAALPDEDRVRSFDAAADHRRGPDGGRDRGRADRGRGLGRAPPRCAESVLVLTDRDGLDRLPVSPRETLEWSASVVWRLTCTARTLRHDERIVPIRQRRGLIFRPQRSPAA